MASMAIYNANNENNIMVKVYPQPNAGTQARHNKNRATERTIQRYRQQHKTDRRAIIT